MIQVIILSEALRMSLSVGFLKEVVKIIHDYYFIIKFTIKLKIMSNFAKSSLGNELIASTTKVNRAGLTCI